MADKHFALCFAPGDEGILATAWAGWVHDGEYDNIGSIQQQNLEDAFAFLLSLLNTGDTVRTIWLYGHGDPDGKLHVPTGPNKSETAIDEDAAQAFIDQSKSAPKFHKFCDEDTAIHAYPCHAGKGDALVAIRLLFTGGYTAKICGPDGWFHLWVGAPNAIKKGIATKSGAGSDCETAMVDLDPESEQELEDAIEEAKKLVVDHPDCYPANAAKKWVPELEKEVRARYEDYFLKVYAGLERANVVPPAVRGKSAKKHRAAALSAMWRLWEATWPADRKTGHKHWVAMPFVADKLLSWERIRALGREKIKKKKSLRGRFGENSDWKKAFRSDPKGAIKAC